MDLTSGNSRHSLQMPISNFRSAAAIAAVAAIAAFLPALGGMAVPPGATLLEGDDTTVGYEAAANSVPETGAKSRANPASSASSSMSPANRDGHWIIILERAVFRLISGISGMSVIKD